MKIRLIRVLQYTYTDSESETAAEIMVKDMAHWAVADGTAQFGPNKVMHSRTLPVEFLEEGE